MSKIRSKTTKPEHFLAIRPFPGHRADECGDTGVIREFDNKVFRQSSMSWDMAKMRIQSQKPARISW